MTASARIGLAALLATCPAVLAAPAASAQSLPLKRPAITPVSVTCPSYPPPPTPVQAQVDEANRLATLAQEASLEGDHRTARDLFSQAASIDGRDPSLAYRLGREYEEMHQQTEAVREYCRYLALVPGAPDAGQVAQRIGQLLPPATLRRGAGIADSIRVGIVRFDSHDWSGASSAFGAAASIEPTLAFAVYDEALADDHDGRRPAAINGYTRYVQLAPQAADAAAVRERIQVLRSSIPSAGKALALGIIPGGGQFYTGQPVLGAAVIAVAAAGVALAIQTKTVTRDTTFVGPFGGTYPGTYTQTQRPNLGIGLGAAGAVTILGAIEAAVVAHGRGAGLSEATSTPRSAALPHVGPVTVELPRLAAASGGAHWEFPVSLRLR